MGSEESISRVIKQFQQIQWKKFVFIYNGFNGILGGHTAGSYFNLILIINSLNF